MIKGKLLEKINDKKTIRINIFISILLVVVLSFISVGFALYEQNLYLNGSTSFGQQGIFAITNVVLTDSVNVKDGSIPSFTDDSIDFNLIFEKSSGSSSNSYKAVYSIELTNETFYDYDFSFASFVPKITNSSGVEVDPSFLTYEVDGINSGELIKAGERRVVTLTILFNPDVDDTYTVDGNLDTEVVEKPHGSLLAGLPDGTVLDLRESLGNTSDGLNISVINSFQADKDYTLSISNPNFELVDSSLNPLGTLNVRGGENVNVPLYVKLKDGARFADDTVTTGISLSYSEGIIECGSITIKVDIDESYIDTTPPIISNVSASIMNATSSDTTKQDVGAIRVTWSVDDEAIDHYTVLCYSVSGGNESLVGEYTTTDRSYTVTGLTDGDYVFKVYGTDSSKNKNTASSSDISSATTSPGYCSKSEVSSYDWHYTVTTNLTYVTSSNTVKAVNRGYNYTTTVTKNANQGNYTYALPANITVRMGSENLSSGTSDGQYQYTGTTSSNSGNITVYGVTGDLNITVTGTRSGGGCGG